MRLVPVAVESILRAFPFVSFFPSSFPFLLSSSPSVDIAARHVAERLNESFRQRGERERERERGKRRNEKKEKRKRKRKTRAVGGRRSPLCSPWGIFVGELFSTYSLASSRSRGHDSGGKYFHKSPTATWIDHEPHRRRHYTLIAPDTSSGYTLTNDIAVRHRVVYARNKHVDVVDHRCSRFPRVRNLFLHPRAMIKLSRVVESQEMNKISPRDD